MSEKRLTAINLSTKEGYGVDLAILLALTPLAVHVPKVLGG